MKAVAAALLGLACVVAQAQGVPAGAERAAAAEAAGNLKEAEELYSQLLAADPARRDLWRRLSDVRAVKGDPKGAAEALQRAAEQLPPDAALWEATARAWSIANDPKRALAAARQALALRPDDLPTLLLVARYAVWSGDLPVAKDAYERLNALTPQDAEVGLALARVSAWSGELDRSAKMLEALRAERPDDAPVLALLAQVELWRGAYAHVLELAQAAQGKPALEAVIAEPRVRALAMLPQPDAARAAAKALDPTLAKPGLAASYALADAAAGRSGEALARLDPLAAANPKDPDVTGAQLLVATPVRSFLSVEPIIARGSDGVVFRDLHVAGELQLDRYTDNRVIAEGDAIRVTAPAGSAYAATDGTTKMEMGRLVGGGQVRLADTVLARVLLGGAAIRDGDSTFVGRARANVFVSDAWTFVPEVWREVFAVSPRALDLGITDSGGGVDVRFAPDPRWVIEGRGQVSRLSDDNTRIEAFAVAKYGWLRNEILNLDVGPLVRYLRYTDDLDDGYYDPQNYQRYALAAFMYVKATENLGASLQASVGAHKDNTMSGFRFGGDLTGEIIWGIYTDWRLRAYGSVLRNGQDNAAYYNGSRYGLELRRRF